LRMNKIALEKIYLCAAIILTAPLFQGCSKDAHDHPELVTGKQLFDFHCSGCHKGTGKGNFLKGVPANKGTQLTIGQLEHKIKSDAKGSKMPSFKNMSAGEARKIATFLKTL